MRSFSFCSSSLPFADAIGVKMSPTTNSPKINSIEHSLLFVSFIGPTSSSSSISLSCPLETARSYGEFGRSTTMLAITAKTFEMESQKRLCSSEQMAHQCDQEQYEEQIEEYLGYACRRDGNTAKAQ